MVRQRGVTTGVWLEDGHVMSRYVTRGLCFVTLLRTPAALLWWCHCAGFENCSADLTGGSIMLSAAVMMMMSCTYSLLSGSQLRYVNAAGRIWPLDGGHMSEVWQANCPVAGAGSRYSVGPAAAAGAEQWFPTFSYYEASGGCVWRRARLMR